LPDAENSAAAGGLEEKGTSPETTNHQHIVIDIALMFEGLHHWDATTSCPVRISEAFLRRVKTEENMSRIKAWEENEKAKAENRQVISLSIFLSRSHEV
jgi:hypothetical protein